MKVSRFFSLFILLMCSGVFAETLTGHVYQGAIGSTHTLGGVTVQLVHNPGSGDVVIDTDATAADGSYSVSGVNLEQYKLVYIVETDPAGFTSVGAQSDGGDVINVNRIRYNSAQLRAGPLSNNNFWDNPPNRPPIAEADGPYFGLVGQSITLDGSASYDPDAGDSIVSWLWDVDGDEAYGDESGETTHHTWAAPFDGYIYLMVYDTHGAKGLDSAHVIISEHWDFGDAPEPYPTLLAAGGAAHAPDVVVLGSLWDGEADGLPSASALGDDSAGQDDEDGIMWPSMTLYPGETVTVAYVLTHLDPAMSPLDVSLHGWIDYDHDHQWDASVGSPEIIVSEHMTVTPGLPYHGSFTFTVPSEAEMGHTYARFRLYGRSEPNGPVHFVHSELFQGYGEVEDYFLNILPAEDRDYGDAPAPYGTLEADSGPSYLLGSITLGSEIDAEMDGQPSSSALGDDGADIDDEDGVLFTALDYTPGGTISGTINVSCAADAAESVRYIMFGWIDFDRDHVFTDFERVVSSSATLDPGNSESIPLSVAVPATASIGHVAARFIVQENPAGTQIVPSAYGGYDRDGEVEDYLLNCTMVHEFDFGDAPSPYPTLAGDGGAFHSIYPFCRMGSLIDPELNGQPAAHAMGDDMAGEDDEDAYTYQQVSFEPGGNIDMSLVVNSYAPERQPVHFHVVRWIDFNCDHVWDDTERFSSGPQTLIGTNSWNWNWSTTAPGDAAIGHTYMRTRLFVVDNPNDQPDFSAEGDGRYGEVEDDFMICLRRDGEDFGDLPVGYPSASHPLGGPWFGDMGDAPDPDPGMQWNMIAIGDDNIDGNDDENGILSHSLYAGSASWLILQSTPFIGHSADDVSAQIWIDYNRNSMFDGAGELVYQHVFHRGDFPPGIVELPFMAHFSIPGFVSPGMVGVRCRISTGDANMVMKPSSGGGSAGEVEDYLLMVERPSIPLDNAIVAVKFHDVNNDAIWSAGEPLLAGWTIYLDGNGNETLDPGEYAAVTNAMGVAVIMNPAPGNYKLCEIHKAGWQQTCPQPVGYYDVTVLAGMIDGPYFFGNTRLGSSSTGQIKWEQPPLYPFLEPGDEAFYQSHPVPSLYGAYLAADDWYCNNSEPVTGVTWWGAYEDWDGKTPPENTPDQFLVAIFDHSHNEDWEHPGNAIHVWFVDRGDFTETLVDSMYIPGQMNKPLSCFEYTFYETECMDWFYQEGDSNHYWLCIAPIYDEMPIENSWGWASRWHYFHSNAVRITDPVSPTGPVSDVESEIIAEQMDLSFVLHTLEYFPQYDFGDAPGKLFTTLNVHNGAKHLIDGEVYLGDAIDAEQDAMPLQNGLGDDSYATDDEDGVQGPNVFYTGELYTCQVQASTTGYLNVWIDMNGDEAWMHSFEQVLDDYPLVAGTQTVSFPIPDYAIPGRTVTRFRFSTEMDLSFYGLALDGEVEDYVGTIKGGETAFLPDGWTIPQNTGSSATIVIPTEANPNIDGEPLENGDYIGVFTFNGFCCGIAKWLGVHTQLTVWGDDPLTEDVVEGFQANEMIYVRIYKTNEGREYNQVYWELSQGNEFYAPDAFMIVSELYATNLAQLQKTLYEGWNGFSFNISNDDGQIDAALQDISNSIVMMKDAMGRTWLPQFDINTMQALDCRWGYKILMSEQAAISVVGEAADPTTPISLDEGWNIIGYLPQFIALPDFCYASLGTNLRLVKDMYGNSYIPEFGINTIGALRPGEAYKLSVEQAVDFSYPVISAGLAKIQMTVQQSPTHFTFIENTGSNALVVISTETAPQYMDSTPLAVGDEIGVFTAEGVCCGAAIWEDKNLVITVWGDDGMTVEKDGFYSQDSLYFHMWSQSQNVEFYAHAETDGSPLVFQDDQLYVVTALVGDYQVGVEQPDALPTTFALEQNYPNPFNPLTHIQYALPQDVHVRLEIYNMKGQLVEILVDEPQKGGYYQIVWNGSGYSSGLYFYKLTAGNFAQTCKMLLVK